MTNSLANGWVAVNTIAPLSLITRSYCSHNKSNGIIVSHLHAVVPYGKSASIISTEPSGISFINSKQSPCNNSISLKLFTSYYNYFYPWIVLVYFKLIFKPFNFFPTVIDYQPCVLHTVQNELLSKVDVVLIFTSVWHNPFESDCDRILLNLQPTCHCTFNVHSA